MNRVKKDWPWAVLNLFALAVMATLVWQSIAVDDFSPNYDPMLVSSGKWAIRFLLLCLLMTPLNTVLGWRGAIKLRKPAGLWAFGFAMAHFVLNVIGLQENWVRAPLPDYMAALGVIGLGILTPMAATSTRWAMKRMGKWWKRLHRLEEVQSRHSSLCALCHVLVTPTREERTPCIRFFVRSPSHWCCC